METSVVRPGNRVCVLILFLIIIFLTIGDPSVCVHMLSLILSVCVLELVFKHLDERLTAVNNLCMKHIRFPKLFF